MSGAPDGGDCSSLPPAVRDAPLVGPEKGSSGEAAGGSGAADNRRSPSLGTIRSVRLILNESP